MRLYCLNSDELSLGRVFSAAAAGAAAAPASVPLLDMVKAPFGPAVMRFRLVIGRSLIWETEKALNFSALDNDGILLTENSVRRLAMRQGLQQLGCVTYDFKCLL